MTLSLKPNQVRRAQGVLHINLDLIACIGKEPFFFLLTLKRRRSFFVSLSNPLFVLSSNISHVFCSETSSILYLSFSLTVFLSVAKWEFVFFFLGLLLKLGVLVLTMR